MSKLNCPNCGAVIEQDKSKCPYCGTSYFDFSNIDFDGAEPCYMRFRHNGMIVMAKVLPRLKEMYQESDVVYAVGSHDEKLMSFTRPYTVYIGVEFEAIQENGYFMKIIKEDND